MKRTVTIAAEEAAFPSPTEHIVSSALLLLSTSPPTNVRKMMKRSESNLSCSKSKAAFSSSSSKRSESNLSCSKSKVASSSSSSSTTSVVCDRNRDCDRDRSSLTPSPSRKLKAIAAFVARFHDLKKLKVVRKKRSKSFWISDGQKISSGKPAEDSVSVSSSASDSTSSCLTTSTSGASSERSWIGRREIESLLKRKPAKVDEKGHVIGSAHMRRRAEAIMKVLASHGFASEVRIRQLLGDSPDTSKALRMLLRREEVKRRGAGGRTDPYIYMIA